MHYVVRHKRAVVWWVEPGPMTRYTFWLERDYGYER